jgi:N-acyl-D-aspartate/D-glutamate deacylase
MARAGAATLTDEGPFDVVIRGGAVLDGSPGATPRLADVAIKGDRICKVGEVLDRGLEEIDASGKLVMPGFVDIHTHYDGQVTWDTRLTPSTFHGVTTVVIGNCGVGFAPCKPHQRELLARVMEGVEDIPGIVITAGVPWKWETFSDYLDFLEPRRYDADCLFLVPHAAIRVYVMGDRAGAYERPTEDDLREMRALVAEAVRAGAVGVSTSRTLSHKDSTGTPAPHVRSGRDELLALAAGLRDGGGGVFQIIPNVHDFHVNQPGDLTEEQIDRVADSEMALIGEIGHLSGCPVYFSLVDIPAAPGLWRKMMDHTRTLNDEGIQVKAVVAPRPPGLLFGLELSLHPFSLHPSYRAIEHLPLEERLELMRRPEVKAKILAENLIPEPLREKHVRRSLNSFRLGTPPKYDPSREASVRFEAERRGVSQWEAAYDWIIEGEGKSIFYAPASNFVGGNLDAAYAMLIDEHAIMGLGDGGAHYGHICDASFQTYMLTYWTRDRVGLKLELGDAVHALTRRAALSVGLSDRGLVAEGMKADINVIDYDGLELMAPEAIYDLPEGGLRIIQKSKGIAATILSGKITYRDGSFTGALPGHMVRSGDAAKSALMTKAG